MKQITCCNGCVAPKRHIGCHDTCPDYDKEKAEYEEDKAKIKEAKRADIEMENYKYEQSRRKEHRMHIKNANRK